MEGNYNRINTMGIVENKEHKLENSKEIPLNRYPPKTAGHIPTV
jgi:hypothetical protein